jgi:hypothetical protein
VYEAVVAKCIAAGLVGGEALSVDASLIKADADKTKRMPGDQPIAWPKPAEASGAVREYLAALDILLLRKRATAVARMMAVLAADESLLRRSR